LTAVRAWQERLDRYAAGGLGRALVPLTTSAAPWVERGGQRLLNLASNNYLGLADDPRLVAAARAGLERWGVGCGASRLLSGDLAVHEELEAELASLEETEAALVFTSGHAASLGLLPTLMGPEDLVLADELLHPSLRDGVRLSGARLELYPHRDVASLRERLAAASTCRGQRFVLTDAVFSMDGDLAPLPRLLGVAQDHDAILIVDDAHGTGIVGPEGRGTAHLQGVGGEIPILLGSLSMALGVQGGFVAGGQVLRDLLIHRARPLTHSTGLAPVLVVAALAAVRLTRDAEGRRRRQLRNVTRLAAGLRERGYRVLHVPPAPMLAIVVGDPEPAMALARRLLDAGVLAPAIRPPSVPAGSSRIRMAPMATHTAEDIELALAAVPPST
jgi:8-amino-7-oxononanoate synthase